MSHVARVSGGGGGVIALSVVCDCEMVCFLLHYLERKRISDTVVV